MVANFSKSSSVAPNDARPISYRPVRQIRSISSPVPARTRQTRDRRRAAHGPAARGTHPYQRVTRPHGHGRQGQTTSTMMMTSKTTTTRTTTRSKTTMTSITTTTTTSNTMDDIRLGRVQRLGVVTNVLRGVEHTERQPVEEVTRAEQAHDRSQREPRAFWRVGQG